ncbi:MAG: hypothetical protein HC779_04245 [Phyllobacteriaceae bacterium]|nr:hypothetical protein [Phyllobacteriaceae bacterium]
MTVCDDVQAAFTQSLCGLQRVESGHLYRAADGLKCMDFRDGHAFWSIRAGLLNTYSILKHDCTCEVVIIGAGITEIVYEAHGVLLKTDRGMMIQAKTVIFAAGYEAQAYLKE